MGRIESLEVDLSSRVREEVQRTQERWSNLDMRVDENSKQFRHWEQMWERLAGYVEDLVVKIQELQGTAAAEAARLPTASNMRPGSRSREATPQRVVPRSRSELPPTLGHPAASSSTTVERTAMADQSASASASTAATLAGHARLDSANSVESRGMWVGPKAIVDVASSGARHPLDVTLDQALSQPSRVTARPKSASSRRGHDWGRP